MHDWRWRVYWLEDSFTKWSEGSSELYYPLGSNEHCEHYLLRAVIMVMVVCTCSRSTRRIQALPVNPENLSSSSASLCILFLQYLSLSPCMYHPDVFPFVTKKYILSTLIIMYFMLLTTLFTYLFLYFWKLWFCHYLIDSWTLSF